MCICVDACVSAYAYGHVYIYMHVYVYVPGKGVRESLAADIPLVIDHFRYFAAVVRGTACLILFV